MEAKSSRFHLKALAIAICAVLAFTVLATLPGKADAATPSKTAISKTVKAQKSITVKWKKNASSAKTGYQIRYSTSSSMKSGVKTVKASKSATSKKVTGLKAATTYYLQIRVAYKKGGKTKYTGWSAKKAVTTKVGSGNASFDNKIEKILSTKIKKTGATGLKRAFNYVAGLRYGNSETSARTGSWTKWSVKYANSMIDKGRGNCYQQAALFAWLAKGLGYDARACQGTYTGGSGKVSQHGWTEVKVSGKWVICDANNQQTANNAGLALNYFKVSKTSATGKKYSGAAA